MKVNFDNCVYLFESFVKLTDGESEYPKLVNSNERVKEVIPKFLKYIEANKAGDVYDDGEQEIVVDKLISLCQNSEHFVHYFTNDEGVFVGKITKGARDIFDWKDFHDEHEEYCAQKRKEFGLE